MKKSKQNRLEMAKTALLRKGTPEAVYNYIFREGNLTTPRKVDKHVLDFCASLNANATPIYVEVRPEPWSRASFCNYNVERMVNLGGGDMVTGYKIWYTANLYIEAEMHALWRSPSGSLVDITFNLSREKRILFLEDRSITDFDESILDKKRVALSGNVQIALERLLEEYKLRAISFVSNWSVWENSESFEEWKERTGS